MPEFEVVELIPDFEVMRLIKFLEGRRNLFEDLFRATFSLTKDGVTSKINLVYFMVSNRIAFIRRINVF